MLTTSISTVRPSKPPAGRPGRGFCHVSGVGCGLTMCCRSTMWASFVGNYCLRRLVGRNNIPLEPCTGQYTIHTTGWYTPKTAPYIIVPPKKPQGLHRKAARALMDPDMGCLRPIYQPTVPAWMCCLAPVRHLFREMDHCTASASRLQR